MASALRSRALLLVVVVVVAGCAGTAGPAASPGDASTDATSSTPPPTTGTLSVHFINVGQSVSTLVVGPTGETMLIDTGHYTDDGEYVLQYLQRHDIDRIDHLVVSHNDADHIGGNAAVIEYYETKADGIGAIHDPGIAASTQTYDEYLDAVEAHNVTLSETREGDRIRFAGVDVAVLGPPEPYLADRARNENSIVLQLTFGNTSVLLPGDAEDDQEAYLVEEYGAQLNAAVLKAGHHGSASSSSGPFLDAVAPKAVIISSAYDSRYGHPDEATLQRLANRSLSTYWTATHGDIVLVSDGDTVSIRTQEPAPTDSTALRAGRPIDPGTTGVIERERLGDGAVETATRTSTATPVPDGGTAGTLTVAEIHADAAGDEYDNLNDEYVVFRNPGKESIELGGWTVSDEADHTYTVPAGFSLGANETVMLHTGRGTDTQDDLYWGSESPIWNNGGDTVTVRNESGTVVVQETYG